MFKNCKFSFFVCRNFDLIRNFILETVGSCSGPVCSSVFKNYPCAFFFSFAGAVGDSFPLRFFVRLFLCCVEGFKFAFFSFFFGRDFVVRVMK